MSLLRNENTAIFVKYEKSGALIECRECCAIIRIQKTGRKNKAIHLFVATKEKVPYLYKI